MTEKEHVTIISTDATTKRYVITNAASDGSTATGTILSDTGNTDTGAGTAGSDEDGGIAVSINLSSATQNVFLVQLKAAIEHANGHNGKIIVSSVPTAADGNQSITLTQNVPGSSGDTVTTTDISQLTAGDFAGGQAAGKLYYLHTTGVWTAVDADAVATGGSQLLAIALGESPSTDGMLIKGVARIDAGYVNGTPAVGAPVYISEETGEFDLVAPSAAADFIRRLGHCLEKDSGSNDFLMWFDPSLEHTELPVAMKNFVLEDGDGTEVTVSNGKEIKFVEGAGIDINWTDTSHGIDADPYDLTFTINLEGTELVSTGESAGTKFLREDGDGTCSWQAAAAANVPQTGSSLWYPPAAANAADDEFNSTSLDSDWLIYNFTDDAAGSVSTDVIDFYGTFNSGNAVRVNAHPASRPSWALVQIPARSKYYTMTKAYSFPTNVLVWMRAKFTQETSIANNDGTVGLMFSATADSHDDPQNGLFLYFNEPDGNIIRTSVWKRESGTWAQVGNVSTDVDSQGQALEYAAIHKVGSNYHLWVGTESNWIYLDKTTLNFTPTRAGFVFQSVNVAPTPMSGIDFIRFVATDKFLL